MKKLILTYLFVIPALALLAQSSVKERGDKLMDKFNYAEALGYYEVAFEEDSTDVAVVRNIGLCLRKLGMIEKSGDWFLKAIQLGSEVPEDKLRYAEALKARMEYAKAVFWYSRFANERPDDRRTQKHIRDTKYFADLWADSLRYDVKALDINSDKPSFGIGRFNGRYIFCSAGIRDLNFDQSAFDEVPFLDVFACDLDASGEAVNASRLDGHVNSKYHDGPAFFDANFQVMYVTRNNMKGGRPVYDKSGTANLQVYAIRLQNGEWEKAEPLPFNSDEYSTGHPTLDLASSRMVFVSNMPGGYGGTDLYEVRYTREGWSAPVNLGPEINTEGNEMFPFISDDGKLYFSSDGHAGLGGMDLFESKLVSGLWAEPINLGFPINSPKDDFAIHYNDDDDFGYFSSNRGEGRTDKIYRFEKVRFMQQIIAMRFETDEDVLMTGKAVTLMNIESGAEEIMYLNGDQGLEVMVNAGEGIKVYLGEGEARGTEPVYIYSAPDELEDTYVTVDVIQLTRRALEDAGWIEALEEIDTMLAQGDTLQAKEKGAELLEMLERLRDETSYLSQDEFEAFTESDLLDSSDLSSLMANNNEELERKNDELRSYELNNIYFGFDSHRLNAAEREKVTALHDILNEDASAQVVIKAHTDSRGNEDYNLLLSMRRAKSVEKALMDMGVSKERFRIAWVGEKELFIDCESRDCDESDHALNRRVEILFVSDLTALNR
jgi:outer membrane protein OmpA-like peptidoglycan-associated protein/tetratricopeptide (TPR) repeat protein